MDAFDLKVNPSGIAKETIVTCSWPRICIALVCRGFSRINPHFDSPGRLSYCEIYMNGPRFQ